MLGVEPTQKKGKGRRERRGIKRRRGGAGGK
jgi:hypothetical protein